MKNLMIFSASCGHVDIRELTDAEWEHWTKPKVLTPPIGPDFLDTPRTRVGRKTRAVYIYPLRYFCCRDCADF